MQCKDNANRAQKRQTCLSGYAEMQLVLYKDNANRAQKRQTCLSGYAEMQLVLSKIMQIERRNVKLVWVIFFAKVIM